MKQLIIDIDCDLLNRIRAAKSVPDMWGADIVNAINAIKSGVPTYERQTGEWITICTLPVIRKCSLCGVEQSGDTILYGNFCPNCGTDMRGKNNGI